MKIFSGLLQIKIMA